MLRSGTIQSCSLTIIASFSFLFALHPMAGLGVNGSSVLHHGRAAFGDRPDVIHLRRANLVTDMADTTVAAQNERALCRVELVTVVSAMSHLNPAACKMFVVKPSTMYRGTPALMSSACSVDHGCGLSAYFARPAP